MKNRNYLVIALAVALIIPIGVLAQAEKPENAQKSEHGITGMHDMMKSCRDHVRRPLPLPTTS